MLYYPATGCITLNCCFVLAVVIVVYNRKTKTIFQIRIYLDFRRKNLLQGLINAIYDVYMSQKDKTSEKVTV